MARDDTESQLATSNGTTMGTGLRGTIVRLGFAPRPTQTGHVMTIDALHGPLERGRDSSPESVAIGVADANIFLCPRCSRPLAVGVVTLRRVRDAPGVRRPATEGRRVRRPRARRRPRRRRRHRRCGDERWSASRGPDRPAAGRRGPVGGTGPVRRAGRHRRAACRSPRSCRPQPCPRSVNRPS